MTPSEAAPRRSSTLRTEDWWSDKLAPVLAAALVGVAASGDPPRRAGPVLGRLAASTVGMGAAAHLVNDLFDRDVDLRAGRSTVAHRLGTPATSLLAVGSAAAGISAWGDRTLGGAATAWSTSIAVLPVAYAAPPLRLKERGAAGVVADAVLAHLAPAGFALAVTTGPPVAARGLRGAVLLWAAAAGLRGILAHELLDEEADRLAGTSTAVIRHGAPAVTRVVHVVVLPLELASLAAATALVARRLPVTGALAAGVLAGGAAARAVGVWTTALPVLPRSRSGRALLWRSYRVWPPLLVAIGLAARDRRWWFAPPVVATLLAPAMVEQATSIAAHAEVARSHGGEMLGSRLVDGRRRALRTLKATVRSAAPGPYRWARRRREGRRPPG